MDDGVGGVSMPELTLNEQTSTGWQRVEFYGDIRKAQSHIYEGRVQMGGMRSMYGVNGRIAEGLPGGFYSMTQTLDDGTTIETETNDGHNIVKIYSPFDPEPKEEPPPPPPPEEYEPPPHYESPIPHGYGDDAEPIENEIPTHELTEEKEEKTISYLADKFEPSLWIGARVLNRTYYGSGIEATPKHRIHLCVWENSNPTGVPRIMSNRHHFGYSNDVLPPEQYPLRNPELMASPKAGPPESPEAGIGCFRDTGLFQLSLPLTQFEYQHNLPMSPPGSDEIYDEVVASDPRDRLGLGLRGRRSGGSYDIKLMIVGDDCEQPGPVEVEILVIAGRNDTGLPGTPKQARSRIITTISAASDYSMAILPYGFYGFIFTSDDPCATCSDPAPDNGPNVHGPMWWQGGGRVYLPPEHEDEWVVEEELSKMVPAVATLSDNATIPDTGFSPGAWLPRSAICRECVTTTIEANAVQLTTEIDAYFTFYLCRQPFFSYIEPEYYTEVRYEILLKNIQITEPVDPESPSIFGKLWRIQDSGEGTAYGDNGASTVAQYGGGFSPIDGIPNARWETYYDVECIGGAVADLSLYRYEKGPAMAPGYIAANSNWSGDTYPVPFQKKTVAAGGLFLERKAEWISMGKLLSYPPHPDASGPTSLLRLQITCTSRERF